MGNNIIYFKNLNGLRFFAAFAVIVHHIEQIKSFYNLENYWDSVPFIKLIGKLGVVLFFVLSGFLITYLLLIEEKKFNKIDIKKFYLRRLLRIWPLYLLIIFLALFILPQIEFFLLPNYSSELIYSEIWQKTFLYIIMMPNLVLTYFGPIPYASQTWSIGTEEQFYLIWPLLLLMFKKNRFSFMFLLIIIYIIIKMFLSDNLSNFLFFKDNIKAFWNSFIISCMAIGGVIALLLFKNSSTLNYLVNNRLFYFVLFSLFVLIGTGVYIPFIHYEFYAVLFGIIILNLAVNNKLKFSLEYPITNYLGSISYGLYMYHTIAIIISIKLAIKFNMPNNYFIIPSTLVLTIVFSHISFKYFEAYFLRFKNKFVRVPSGNNKIIDVLDTPK